MANLAVKVPDVGTAIASTSEERRGRAFGTMDGIRPELMEQLSDEPVV